MNRGTSAVSEDAREFWDLLLGALKVDGPNWDSVLDFLRGHKEVAKVPDGGNGALPLHTACHGAPRELIEQLLLIHPDAARIPDTNGDLPIHKLFWEFPSGSGFINEDKPIDDEVVRLIVEANPAAARIKDHRNDFPLHLATEREGVSLKTLQILLAAYPGAASIIEGGDLPIHLACVFWAKSPSDGELSKKLEALITANPDGVSTKNSDGRLPLHEITHTIWGSLTREKLNAFKIIYNANPNAATIADNEGYLPLYLVTGPILNESPSDIELHNELFTFLLTANPKAACQPDNKGLLPLHSSCFFWPKNCGRMLTSLLAAKSSAICSVESEGNTPLFYALVRETDSNEFVARLFLFSDTRVFLRQIEQTTVALAAAVAQNNPLEKRSETVEKNVRDAKKMVGCLLYYFIRIGARPDSFVDICF